MWVRQTASGARAGTARKSERALTQKRSTTPLANRHSPTNKGTTPQRRCGRNRRSLWRFGHRTNRQCLRQQPERLPPRRPEASATGAQRQLAEAGGTDAASECRARDCLLCRAARRKSPKGLTAPGYKPSRPKSGLPRSGDSKSGVTGSAWHTAFDGGTTQHGSGGRTLAVGTGVPEAAGCPNQHLMDEAGHSMRNLPTFPRCCTLRAGTRKVRSFATGQGRGWPWSKTPCLPPTTTGRDIRKTVLRSSVRGT